MGCFQLSSVGSRCLDGLPTCGSGYEPCVSVTWDAESYESDAKSAVRMVTTYSMG